MAFLAIFEDSITGTRVKEFRQSLSRDLGRECRIIEHVWLFNTLRLRELREIAAEEAAASDLIIIAARRSEALPDEVRDWIELWAEPTVRHPTVLLALLDRRMGVTPIACKPTCRQSPAGAAWNS